MWIDIETIVFGQIPRCFFAVDFGTVGDTTIDENRTGGVYCDVSIPQISWPRGHRLHSYQWVSVGISSSASDIMKDHERSWHIKSMIIMTFAHHIIIIYYYYHN